MRPHSKRAKLSKPAPSDEGRAVKACVWGSVRKGDYTLETTSWQALKNAAQHGSIETLYAALWEFLWHKSAKNRFAALLICEALFDRSVEFRRSICLDLALLSDAMLGIDSTRPLPDAARVGEMLKRHAIAVLHRWHQRYVVPLLPSSLPRDTQDYRTQLHLHYCFLRDKRDIEFTPPQSEIERQEAIRRTRRSNAEKELNDSEAAISLNLLEMENALLLLLPSFDDRYGASALLHVEAMEGPDEGPALEVDEFSDDSSSNSNNNNNNQVEEAQGLDADLREVSVPPNTVVDVTIRTRALVAATSDSVPLMRVCRDGLRLLQKCHWPLMRHWRDQFALRSGVDDGNGEVLRARVDALWERATRVEKQCELLRE